MGGFLRFLGGVFGTVVGKPWADGIRRRDSFAATMLPGLSLGRGRVNP